MEASGTQSHLLPLNLLDIDSAMDLLTAFIPQNSPARLAELVSSSALDPVHTEILYGILGSPLEFTSGGFIDASNEVVLPIGEFLLRALVGCVPRDSIRVLGQRRRRWNPSCVYSRKRKAQSLGSTSVLLMSSKKRSLLAHERGKEKKVEVPYSWKKQFMLLSFSNTISAKVLQANFDVASPSGSYQHLAGPGSFDYRVMGSDKTYSLQMSLQELSCHELRSISYPGEGTRENSSHISCSGIHDVKYADSTSEDTSPDVERDANLMKEQAYQCSTVIKPECRPLQDQSSSITRTLGEECNALSLESVFTYGFHKEHAIERTNRLEPDFETLLMDQMIDQTEFHEIDYNTESISALLDCSNSNHLIVNANDERKLYSKNAELITSLLDSKETLVDSIPGHCYKKGTSLLDYKVGSNGAATEFMLQTRSCDKPADAAKDKQRAFNPPYKKDHFASANLPNLVGPSIASNGTSSIKKQYRNAEAGLFAKQKVQNACDVKKTFKQNMVDVVVKPMKDSSEQKLMPNFESFIIEEEEGSGGYGTVYKAQRKDDGKIFAVKCPHANAHSHHVNNELKMLERFGGRNFVIKYEGSFKNGDSECFVLEHVEHDRPEVLKKEIDMFELQWYGYCMFRALTSLHKQGIVHRDVKPGNFLFSRQLNKGYLIDFNLASDLHQKFCRSGKRKTPSAVMNANPLLKSKPVPIVLSRKFIDRGLLEIAKKEAANESKKAIASKASKKKPHKGDMDGRPIAERSKHGSQTADGSGLTSTKDQTSTKTPVDWLNQPMPNKGRKELINFVRKAVNSPQNLKPLSNGPSSQRKRVAAPMTKTDARLLIFTPMPLHSAGNAVAGAGMLKNKAGGKAKREGPCVGTKGFRAPEVLFKSFHQGCKIDVWSAGVTMLYFMIGRAPFGGDPEHAHASPRKPAIYAVYLLLRNVKEIAKLRGSEDLWEIAKLHNCESSFPVDLLEVESLKSMELRDWCAKNTKRPEFMELIPRSLFDLVDRCLTVNPRLRLSAEEALMHKFFAPCHESIRRQRLLRKPECRAETNGSSI